MILVRHGEAGWDQAVDSDRTLTDRGKAYLKQQKITYQQHLRKVDGVISSPYIRTRQTLDLLLDDFDLAGRGVTIEYDDRITPDVSISQALQALEQYWSENLLVITHQPLIGSLTSYLVEGSLHNPEPVMPGQFIFLELEWPAASMATRLSY